MAKFTLKVYAPLKLHKWYSHLTPQEKLELAEACNKSVSFVSQVMCRRSPMSLELAKSFIAFSKGIFTLEEIYPVDKANLQKSGKLYIWYSKLSAQEKKELAELCSISTAWLSRLMRGQGVMTEDIENKVISFSKGKLN